MKNSKNLKIKILLSVVLLVIVSAVTYISLPYISYALENASNNFLENIGKITNPANQVTMDKEQIHEHRGYGIIANWYSKAEKASYDAAAGNTGISTSQMQSYIQTNLSPYIPLNTSLGWVNTLLLNTSVFCIEEGVPFPGLNARVFNAFHVSNIDTETYRFIDNVKIQDFIEWNPNLVCKKTITIYKENYKDGGVELITSEMDEGSVWFSSGFKYVMDEFRKVTTVRVRYTAYPDTFDTAQSYIFTYSLRNYYTYNPAQIALWKYENDIWVTNKTYCDADTITKARQLYNSAMAVKELSNPTKPQISTSTTTDSNGLTYSTGTVLDGNYYKVGPFKMNGYSYGWTADAKEYSGDSSVKNPKNKELLDNKDDAQIDFFKGIIAGIVEAKLELDNNAGEIILDKDNFIVEGGNATSGSEFYSYPTMADGYEYPTPNSTFYIKLPISECVGATSVQKITMKYKWHTADGNGGYLDGYYDELIWSTREPDGGIYTVGHNDSTTYKCDHSHNGYECIHDSLPWNGVSATAGNKSNRNVSSCWYGYGWDEYDVNFFSHDFWCDGDKEWCMYGSSADSTTSADVTPGSTRYTNKITTSCYSSWACGYYYHKHGNTWDNGSDGQDHVNDSDTVHYYCNCSHNHTTGCFSRDCGYSTGQLVCSSSSHTHSTDNGCYHAHTTSCGAEAGGSYSCGYEAGDLTCKTTPHSHSSSKGCYHYHSGSSSDGSGCYGQQDCPHYPGTSYCANLNGCCEYYVHTHSIGTCGKDHDCTMNYCIHGFANGKHTCEVDTSHTGTSCDGRDWGDTHIGNCYGPPGEGTRCNAHPEADGGGHRNCATFYWFLVKETVMDVQKLAYVSDAQVYEHNEECYIENIPLVAKVEIDKYVFDVEHAKSVDGVDDDSFGPSDARRELEETTKEGNPVYVETDDYVTYKIVLKNSSNFGVKVRIDDILPEATAYEFISAYIGGSEITDLTALRNSIIQVNANSEASATITLQVKALEGKYVNKARIITRNGTSKNNDDDIDYIRTVDDDGPVVNHIETTCQGNTDTPDWESSDWFILNNYNTFIDKYLYKYDEKVQNENNNVLFITNEESIVDGDDILKESRVNTKTSTKKVSDGNLEDTIRINNKVTDKNGNLVSEHELYKANHPVNVEKYESVTYAIRVYNDATEVKNTHETGVKPATKVKITTVEDKLHKGLQYTDITAKIFNKDGSVKVDNVLGVGCSPAGSSGEYNIYNITTSDTTVLNGGEYIEFYMKVKVVQSNMYLYEMNNEAKIKKISNINDVDVTTRNIAEQDSTTEYVRMKDLVISGRVWLDFDKDGLMSEGDYPTNDLDKINNNINEFGMKEDVIVRLYRVGDSNNPIRTTKTDENGLYTFSRTENMSWYQTYNNTVDYSEDTDYQRIDKASNKDKTSGNYTSSSEYYQYYVEFVYDGVVYKSTEVYADMDNLNDNGSLKEYPEDIDKRYKRDSNAAELEEDRANFNTIYEYISYDIAYDLDLNETDNGNLVFQKDGHESYLMENPAREMTAKSFINKGSQDIKYLWLYPFNSSDRANPETEYLKYINLGLELREDVDLALSKDVYNVKTTINGEEMEYDYNLGNTGEYFDDYIVKKPYGFEIYESDYKYRIEQYIAEAVENFKGNGADELNIEVTYRINLQNVRTPDAEGRSEDTDLNVKVHEVLDLYDENFMDITAGDVTAKVKDKNGLLIDKQIKTVEAWMFKKTDEVKDGEELLEGGKTYSIRTLTAGGEPTYVADSTDGDYVKVKLEVSNASSRGTNGVFSNKNNDFSDDGYKTAYIRGTGDITILEGESIDIYVKYLLDKDDDVWIDINEEALADSEKENSNIDDVLDTENSTLKRSLKIAERVKGVITDKGANGRGTENIAQINAYSVWYDPAGTEPASLVDKDSNAGNIGIKNLSEGKSPNGSGYVEGETSADDIDYYEDITYKTGIDIVAKGTENPPPPPPPPDEPGEPELTRKISGTVWDDSRSETMGSGNEVQYIGDGTYKTGGKNPQAKSNDNVDLNYKDDSVTEKTDIAVRNAKAEFVEVINVDGKYYEEVLSHVTWEQKQNARTEDDGTYTLYGFMPGTYIVRFTYGDVDKDIDWEQIENKYATIDSTEGISDTQKLEQKLNFLETDFLAVKDMLIFNGQDYKSTKYTGVNENLNTYEAADDIIVEFNVEHKSDARDDEIRRLEVNNYSEIMTNETAEILKGLANGTKLTPHSKANNSDELKALVENTYMTADTREFLVKPEKLTDTTDGLELEDTQKVQYKDEDKYVETKPYYKDFTSMKNEHIEERVFEIKNVDFGIEYRPESEISLMKEIVQLTLITEDDDILVDLHFDTKNTKGKDGKDTIVHEINKDRSVGYELVQFITNDYQPKSLINNILSEEYVQGLVYIQVDEEILQGCTVKITYGFNAQNCSEVDRISTNLNDIRYRYNKATNDLINTYENRYKEIKPQVSLDIGNVIRGKYTASAMAKAVVFADSYGIDGQGIPYRERAKTLTTNGEDGYYGRYVGHSYYSGVIATYKNDKGENVPFDTVSSLKFDKILDYIDTNLEYEQKTTSEEVTDRLWSKITSRELISLVSHYKGLREEVSSMTDEELPKVTDINGVEYKSMVVSVDDRNIDPGDENEEKDERAKATKNKDLSRFLVPKVIAVGLNGNDDDGKQNDKDGKLGYDDYTGHIYLDVSKVLAAGSENDDKTYENMAEIVQFTTLNGRRTNFATTIGNANIHDIKDRLDNDKPPFDDTSGKNSGSIEFITASIEPDTSATETITLIPPTGLMKNRRAIVSIMETAKAGVEVMSMTGLVVAIIAVIAFVVLLAVRKYKKRRIK